MPHKHCPGCPPLPASSYCEPTNVFKSQVCARLPLPVPADICWLPARTRPQPAPSMCLPGSFLEFTAWEDPHAAADGGTDGAQPPHGCPPREQGHLHPALHPGRAGQRGGGKHGVPSSAQHHCHSGHGAILPLQKLHLVHRAAKVSPLHTINSLFIVSICREVATLISGLLHKAYSRLLSELKRQMQMPRSLLPTGSHLSEEEELWSNL